MKALHDQLRNSRYQADKLAETVSVLDDVFAGEGTHLKRHDGASLLCATCRAVAERLQQLRQLELSASRGHSQANLALSLVELGVTAVFSKGNRLSAVADCLINGPTSRKQPFGLVMAYIGPRGLPEDTGAVSISQQAREANQPEHEIINRLRDAGCLLFSQEEFFRMIDRVAGDIRAGKLCLPIARDRLAEIVALRQPISTVEITPLY